MPPSTTAGVLPGSPRPAIIPPPFEPVAGAGSVLPPPAGPAQPVTLDLPSSAAYVQPNVRYESTALRLTGWQILIIGYMTFGRSFAYIGIPPLFIGELYIARYIAFNPRRWLNKFMTDCLHWRLMPLSIMLMMLWGFVEVFRGYELGHPIPETLRTFAFNYYPICLRIGISIGARLNLQKFIRFWKRFSLFFIAYSLLFMFWGQSSDVNLPWADVPVFGAPVNMVPIALGTLALWPYLRRWIWRTFTVVMGTAPIFFMPGRGVFLGLLLGLVVVSFTSRRRFLTVWGAGIIFATLLGMFGSMIPAGQDGQTMSAMVPIAQVIATFDDQAAYKLLMEHGERRAAEDMLIKQGTADWRRAIWRNALHSLNTSTLVFLGQGHGTNINDLTPDHQELHTPHNCMIYALYYTGAVGLAIFILMLLSLLWQCFWMRDPNLRALCLSITVGTIMLAVVGNMFETPHAAIPFYLLIGVTIGMDTRLAAFSPKAQAARAMGPSYPQAPHA